MSYCASGLSWSWKMSGRRMVRILRPASSQALVAGEGQDVRAEPADRAFLDRDDHLVGRASA